jgi:hypothetical protein
MLISCKKYFQSFKLKKPLVFLDINASLDIDYLIKSAKRAKIAYLNPDEINKLWLNKDNILGDAIECPIYITNDAADAYFWNEKIEDENVMNVIFRGTNSIQDAISDLDLRLTPMLNHDKKIRVHDGFYKQFLLLEPKITELIKNSDSNTLYIAGHSLGAGIGQIAAGFYGEKNMNVNICTIGCPRTGNNEFVEWFQKNVKQNIRIVNQYDPVPLIPIEPVWVHTNGFLIKKNLKYMLYLSEKNGLKRWLRPIYFFTSQINYNEPIKEHKCDIYIYNLSQLNGEIK